MRQPSFKASGLGPEQQASLIIEVRRYRVPGPCEWGTVGWWRKTMNEEYVSREDRDLI